MDPLEQKLKKALEAREPAAGFAERVVARALAEGRREARSVVKMDASWWRRWFTVPAWRLATAGALAAVLVAGGGIAYRQREIERVERVRAENVRAEKARDELLLALEITSSKLNLARHAVIESTRDRNEVRQ